MKRKRLKTSALDRIQTHDVHDKNMFQLMKYQKRKPPKI